MSDKTYTTITEAAQVTEEILNLAWDKVEGWYMDSAIDWDDVWDRMDGTTLGDGTTLDMGNSVDTPAIRKIKRTMNQWKREAQ